MNQSWVNNLQVEEIIQISEDKVILIARYEPLISPKPRSRLKEVLRKFTPPCRSVLKRLPLIFLAWRVVPKVWRVVREFLESI